MKKILLALALAVPVFTTGELQAEPTIPTGKDRIIKAIRDADKVIVKEHANPIDFGSKEKLSQMPVYKTATLTSGQRKLLIDDLAKIKGSGISPLTSCVFDPHHTMEFHKGGKLINSVLICYRCDAIKFSNSSRKGAMGIVAAMAPGLKKAGFTTERDWRKFGKEQLKKAAE